MDWDLKMQWDLGELDPNAESINMGSMVGPSSGRLDDCSVDLKLGGLGDFGLSEKWKGQQQVSMPSSSSKRSRAPNNSNQNVSCLVQGCKADLSNCREYHRRHKVCEVHSKTPRVMVGGQEQRFCQQCSRFHLLVEFDEVKRSCRKRLDGHNRRRRKPQPESFNSGSLFTDHQGSRFSSYSHLFPTSAADPNWPIMVKAEDDTLYSNHPTLPILDPQQHHFASQGKHFPLLQESRSGSNSSKIFNNGLAHVLESDCALSLLSSPQLGQIVTDRIPMGQPLLSYGGGLGLGHQTAAAASNHMSTTIFSCSGMEDECGTAVLVSDTGDHDVNCQGLFGSGDGGSQALPFSWQ